MTQLIKVHPNKKRGRPATGKDPLVSARLPWTLIDQIEEWCATTRVGRSEAIRQLLEIGLKTAKSPKPVGKAIPSLRAAKLPARDIEDERPHSPSGRTRPGSRLPHQRAGGVLRGRVDLPMAKGSDRNEGK